MALFQKTLISLLILAALSVAGVLIVGDQGVIDLYRERSIWQKMNLENRKIQKENESLAKEIYRLKNDPVYLEDVARRTLKLVSKEDIVINITPSGDNKTDTQTK